MHIQEIYDKYKIMPALQTHMKRVAIVGMLVAENSTNSSVYIDDIMDALLLHDMGNILKFDLHAFPDFIEPKGFDYWQKIQDTYREMYGNDEHNATYLIARELQVNTYIYDLICSIGFSQAKANYETDDMNKKICAYADMRVGPYGVMSRKKRMEDIFKRYKEKGRKQAIDFDQQVSYIADIEKQIFHENTLFPENITDSVVTNLLDEGICNDLVIG